MKKPSIPTSVIVSSLPLFPFGSARAALLALAAGLGTAAASDWLGTTNNFGTASNWSPSGTPSGETGVVVFGASAANKSVFLGSGNRSANTLTIDSAASYTLNLWDTNGTTRRTFTLSGVDPTVTVLAGHHIITGDDGTLNSNGALSLASSGATGVTTFNIVANASLTLDAKLTSRSGQPLEKTGDGRLVIGVNNSPSTTWRFTDDDASFQIKGGTLVLAAGGASGHSGNRYTVSGGATLELAATGTPYVSHNGNLTLSGGGFGGVGALYASETTSINNGTGSVVLAANAAIGVAAGKTLTVEQEITGGSVVLTKTGAGTLNLTNGANDYGGGTIVSAGTLLANNTSGSATGDGDVEVDGAGTIVGGSGSIGNLSVTTGTVAPGNSTGILTTGDFTLGAGGFYQAEISTADDHDALVANGSVTLSGTLDLILLDGWSLANGELLFILRNDGSDPIAGNFAGLGEGAIFTAEGQDFLITYQANFTGDENNAFTGGNDVALMVIPEPSLPLLAGVGAMCFWTIRRRRNP